MTQSDGALSLWDWPSSHGAGPLRPVPNDHAKSGPALCTLGPGAEVPRGYPESGGRHQAVGELPARHDQRGRGLSRHDRGGAGDRPAVILCTTICLAGAESHSWEYKQQYSRGVAGTVSGGASSAVAASAHASCARFRGTDPLITGISRRKLAQDVGYSKGLESTIPLLRWMRAMRFEELVGTRDSPAKWSPRPSARSAWTDRPES